MVVTPVYSHIHVPHGLVGYVTTPIVLRIDDSDSVFYMFHDSNLGDFRWALRSRSTKRGWVRKYVHPWYCPRGSYFHPETGRKVHICSKRGIEEFIAVHNLYDPWYNPNSPFSV